ncbi:YcsE-related riboflavin metabolism phosphatase [Mycoplasma marinum]|uniref:Cof-type HAD-IIB family hydrolase n=1 Tax=Mycoplasma marinum TaxID=1937190 RepID=A0A4R0XPH1_9MOLU|nr:Cof-type HAD-IIB family hydrolase [Mycoplasma marinum]TCG11422.1 Cof-type HAD-IIB family hydrolase [Mycoplasma marinum]
MYKIFAFDIDGTLLPFEQKNLDQEIVLMFKRLKEQGKTNVLITGRDFVTIGDMINTPHVDYFIGANGAFIFDLKTKELVFEKYIEHGDLVKLQEFCKEHDFNYSITTEKAIYFKDKTKCKDNWFWDDFYEIIKPVNHEDMLNERIHQVNIDVLADIEKATLVNYIDDLPNIDVNTVWERGLFIGPEDINKAFGLKELGKITDISIEHMMAFGDSDNDIPMLKEVGCGIAMGDAKGDIKAIANDTCGSVKDFGTIKKLEELQII